MDLWLKQVHESVALNSPGNAGAVQLGTSIRYLVPDLPLKGSFFGQLLRCQVPCLGLLRYLASELGIWYLA